MKIDNYYKRIGDFTLTKVDRRILKSQEAIKKAVLELMTEKSFDRITIQDIANRANVSRRTIYLHYTDKYDLLDQLVKVHMNELRSICESAVDLSLKEANLLWFEYFEKNYLFFSTMLASDGATFFRSQFLEFVVQEVKKHHISDGENQTLDQEVFIQFFGSASVGLVEWWIKNGIPLSPRDITQQLGGFLDKICTNTY
ncbi:TetR/AcrR family transcriptional regulator [Enterococcus faecium]|nr:TetR/AcrR family transcriptional regulator [Enterococcus faecium]